MKKRVVKNIKIAVVKFAGCCWDDHHCTCIFV